MDRFPQDTPVVAVMSQCYSGSFANFIYQGGDPESPVSPQPRCGFFATVKDRTAVGCTAEVDESDYQDYSSSFFAGLSGYSRTRRAVASADYDHDGHVSYAEAHAFAKVDEQSSDRPISTSESWLQSQARTEDEDEIASSPISTLLQSARPEQRYVVESLAERLGLDVSGSWVDNQTTLQHQEQTDEHEAYAERLRMELINIGMEAKLREQEDEEVAVLERILACESGSWSAPTATAAAPANVTAPREDAGLCGSSEAEGRTPHHIATVADLTPTSTDEQPWTPRFEELFSRNGLSLEDPANLIYLRGHVTPHPEEYHREVYERLRDTLEGCGDQKTCARMLQMALHRLGSELCLPHTRLNELVTR